MSDESRFSDHTRGVVVTTVACLAGIAAAFASAVYLGVSAEAAVSTIAVVILGLFVVAQFPLLNVIGIDIGDFGVKDNLYVTFMTFTLWFLTYTILLSTRVEIPL
ncbi:MAG: hypothetical protein A07HR60_00020 [uncultured archaeon A07HR60]|jgi:uncharacterized membrane protein|nr:MAG: hypothetical protein A07HR60_00020 [uncultured archaeon A07HR60]